MQKKRGVEREGEKGVVVVDVVVDVVVVDGHTKTFISLRASYNKSQTIIIIIIMANQNFNYIE